MRNFTVFLIALASYAGCGDSQPPSSVPSSERYVARGADAVGFREIKAGDGLTIKAWYPSTDVADDTVEHAIFLKWPSFPHELVSIGGQASQDSALAARAPLPLVVFSHGFALNPEWYHTLTEHFASYGFVVFAPEHTESNWSPDVLRATVDRPADVRRTIDFATRGEWSEIIDSDRIAVVGHSYGGMTALASVGARIDLQSLRTRCQGIDSDTYEFNNFCAPFIDGDFALAELMSLESPPEELWPSVADERVKAAVTMAGDAYLFGEVGLAEVSLPTMALGGTADFATPWDLGTQLNYDSISSNQRSLAAFNERGRFLPVATCDTMPFTSELPGELQEIICNDPSWDRATALSLTRHLATAFLLAALNRDLDAQETLTSNYSETHPELRVVYERE